MKTTKGAGDFPQTKKINGKIYKVYTWIGFCFDQKTLESSRQELKTIAEDLKRKRIHDQYPFSYRVVISSYQEHGRKLKRAILYVFDPITN